MGKKRRVVISGMTGVSDQMLAVLKDNIINEYADAQVEIASVPPLPEVEIIKKLQGADVLVSGFQQMSEKAYAETNLMAYCIVSTGFDFANPELATKHGVVVTSNPDYCVDEVAEHSVALILQCARGLYKMVPYVKAGNWGCKYLIPMNRFAGSTVGLYGFGRIPKKVASKLSGFDVDMIACDPFVTQEQADPYHVKMVDFDTLLSASDYLSIHAPLMPSTTGIFNEAAFSRMKPSAFLINAARGPIIDQEALYIALRDGWIKGAALDVMRSEPPKEEDRKLIELPNIIVTGHCAFYSEQSSEKQLRLNAEEVGRVLRGEKPRNIVNKEVLTKVQWVKE